MAGGFSSGFSSGFDVGGFDVGFGPAPIATLLGYATAPVPAAGQNFSFVRGDDVMVTINVTKGDGTVLGIADDATVTARWSYSRRQGSPPLVTKTEADDLELIIEDGALTVNLVLVSADTELLLGDYRHELELTIGGAVSTVTTGWFSATPDMRVIA